MGAEGFDIMETEHNFEFDAGRLCLDFANTLGDRPDESPHEEDLHTYADLVAWSEAAGILSTDDAAEMEREAARRPADAERAFAAVIALREAIYRLFSAIAARAEPPVDDLDAVNRAIATATAHGHLAPVHGHFHWQWEHDASVLDSMIWPVAWSVAELLLSEELHRVHECAGPDCGWLFMDTSKNGSRRWCSMETCGNRAKARRHRARLRAVAT
jgi:predicted RNA-binding Zn ribbon-like protein